MLRPMARTSGGSDKAAATVGAIRLASGLSFLVAPEAANKLWGGDPTDVGPTASLLLRSMGYRDALIGGMLLKAALAGDASATATWYLASAGADTADFVGGLANHHRMTDDAKRKGIGGAAVGITVGLLGAARARSRAARA